MSRAPQHAWKFQMSTADQYGDTVHITGPSGTRITSAPTGRERGTVIDWLLAHHEAELSNDDRIEIYRGSTLVWSFDVIGARTEAAQRNRKPRP